MKATIFVRTIFEMILKINILKYGKINNPI